MARAGATPNNPALSRNPPPKSRKQPSSGNPSTSRNPPRDPPVLSSRAQRTAPSQPNQPQSSFPQANATVRPILDYKLLYPWAPHALLNETSSINTEVAIHCLRDKTHLTFHKEHDDKVAIRPCPPVEPVCTDNDDNDGHPFCFIYAIVLAEAQAYFRVQRPLRVYRLAFCAAQRHFCVRSAACPSEHSLTAKIPIPAS